MTTNELPIPYKSISYIQIGKNKLQVMYYFIEEDTIHCKVIATCGSNAFEIDEVFITHYKSLIV